MLVKLYGTRGSIPISNPDSIRYGGNTTCLRIFSDFIPKDTALIIDAGSGYVPMAKELMQDGEITKIVVLFTHYHHDHTQGLPLAPTTFIPKYRMRLIGPLDHGFGPKEMLEKIMCPPVFPVHYKEVASRFPTMDALEYPQTMVLLVHPKGGIKMMGVDDLQKLSAKGDARISFNDGGKYPLPECMVVRMHKTKHPECTISYRFEEPTGKVFTFLTDHENTDGLPLALRNHIRGSDLLVVDAQYLEDTYRKRTAGYGHGTPRYVMRLASECGVNRVGLTHHDPSSTDEDVDAIVREALASPHFRPEMEVFACGDYMVVPV